ncbi:MAG: SDR family oxidoreductase [Verrucomicrobiota bacterium]|nr:SDR family oxidoreductase [Verrucomicrobiota bacterium]
MFWRKSTGRPATRKVQNESRPCLAKRYSRRVRALIIGCGYVGEALGQRLIALGHDVTGVRRSHDHNARLARFGIHPVNLDITEQGALAKLDGQYDWVIIATSSSRDGEEAYRNVYGLGSENIARWLKTADARAVVFISSTSVYKQINAEWVSENEVAPPEHGTGKILWEAEQTIAASPPVTILRSSGIYGPGRGHLFRRFMSGNAAIKGEGKRYLNMVHRDDLVGSITAVLGLGAQFGIYNITDDEPVTELTFYRWLSETTGRPMPPFVPEPDPSTRKRGLTNKRVSNKSFKETYGFKYKYPTYREGYTNEMEDGLKTP